MRHLIYAVVFCSVAAFAAQGQSANPLLEPVPRETQVYKQNKQGWMERHEAVKQQAALGQAELVFIGDSITHWWDSDLWEKHYAPLNAINMGFGGDKVQHVLWRLQNGEIDGISPKVAVVMIGTNNAGSDTPEQIAEAIKEICSVLRKKLPQTQILLLAIFPRNTPQDPRHLNNLAVNKIISGFADGKQIHYLDISGAFTENDGTIPRAMMNDLLHPTPLGYQAWADAMNPALMKLLGKTGNN